MFCPTQPWSAHLYQDLGGYESVKAVFDGVLARQGEKMMSETNLVPSPTLWSTCVESTEC